jgi:hypothetical protein
MKPASANGFLPGVLLQSSSAGLSKIRSEWRTPLPEYRNFLGSMVETDAREEEQSIQTHRLAAILPRLRIPITLSDCCANHVEPVDA